MPKPTILEHSDMVTPTSTAEATAVELERLFSYLSVPRSYAFAHAGGKLANILKVDTKGRHKAIIATLQIKRRLSIVREQDESTTLEIYGIATAYFIFKLAKIGDFIVCPELKLTFLAPSALGDSEPRPMWVANVAVNVTAMARHRRIPESDTLSRSFLKEINEEKAKTVQELGENGQLW